jgi:predicted CXXCH cytochrome family protein
MVDRSTSCRCSGTVSSRILMSASGITRPLSLTVLFVLLASRAWPQVPNQLPDADASKYVGVEVCQGCHEDSYKSFAASAHLRTLKRQRVSEQGCEGCHGPGAEHAEAGDPDKIRRFPSESPEAIRATCTACHEANLGVAHTKARLTCLTCHSAHHYQQLKSILVGSQVQVCTRCHKF